MHYLPLIFLSSLQDIYISCTLTRGWHTCIFCYHTEDIVHGFSSKTYEQQYFWKNYYFFGRVCVFNFDYSSIFTMRALSWHFLFLCANGILNSIHFLRLLKIFLSSTCDNITYHSIQLQTIESSPFGENCEGQAVTLSQLASS